MSIQNLNLPNELDEKFEFLANEAGVSKNDYIIQALFRFLEDKEDVEAAEIMLQQIRNGEMKTYTLKEVEKNCGLDY